MRMLATLALTASAALAQDPQLLQPRKARGPVKDAGVYHVASGTWSRATPAGQSDVIYSSTAPTGYYAYLLGDGTDEGALPGPDHPAAGPFHNYRIDGFQISYCAYGYQDLELELRFFDSYTACDTPSNPDHCIHLAHELVLDALPIGDCWTVTLDLSGGDEFVLAADGGLCDPGYQPGTSQFGWGHTWIGSGATTNATVGHMLAGYDPTWAAPGGGTVYDPTPNCRGGNTALGSSDGVAIDNWTFSGPQDGCYWFGGYVSSDGCGSPSNAGAQFHLELYSTDTPPSPVGAPYCYGPGQNGELSLSTNSVSAGSITFKVSGLEGPTLFGKALVGQGTQPFNPPGSQGHPGLPPWGPSGPKTYLCLTGAPIGRYYWVNAVAGHHTWETDIWNGVSGTNNGKLPNPPGGYLQAGDTWNFQAWQRMGAGQASTFTTALSVTFEP